METSCICGSYSDQVTTVHVNLLSDFLRYMICLSNLVSCVPYTYCRFSALCSRCVYLFPLRNWSDSPVQSYSTLCGQHQAIVALALKTRTKNKSVLVSIRGKNKVWPLPWTGVIVKCSLLISNVPEQVQTFVLLWLKDLLYFTLFWFKYLKQVLKLIKF